MHYLNKSTLSFAQLMRDATHRAKVFGAQLRPLVKPLAICSIALIANAATAADWGTPGVSTIDGLSDAKDPGEMIQISGKFLLKMVLWLIAIGTGIVVAINIAKSVKKVHRDEDARWGNVIGEIAGNVVVFLFILAFIAWLTSQFT